MAVPKTKYFLIVDDDEDDRFLFREALGEVSKDIVSHEAANGRAAIDLLSDEKQRLPSVIFLDINMPVMNGWECMEKLRNDKRLSKIPVVVYSTSSMEPDIRRSLTMGALCFCVKVDDYDKLKSLLEVIVNNYDKDLQRAMVNHPVGRSCFFKAA